MKKGGCAIMGWGGEGDKEKGKLSKQFFPRRVKLKEFTEPVPVFYDSC